MGSTTEGSTIQEAVEIPLDEKDDSELEDYNVGGEYSLKDVLGSFESGDDFEHLVGFESTSYPILGMRMPGYRMETDEGFGRKVGYVAGIKLPSSAEDLARRYLGEEDHANIISFDNSISVMVQFERLEDVDGSDEMSDERLVDTDEGLVDEITEQSHRKREAIEGMIRMYRMSSGQQEWNPLESVANMLEHLEERNRIDEGMREEYDEMMDVLNSHRCEWENAEYV